MYSFESPAMMTEQQPTGPNKVNGKTNKENTPEHRLWIFIIMCYFIHRNIRFLRTVRWGLRKYLFNYSNYTRVPWVESCLLSFTILIKFALHHAVLLLPSAILRGSWFFCQVEWTHRHTLQDTNVCISCSIFLMKRFLFCAIGACTVAAHIDITHSFFQWDEMMASTRWCAYALC